ncbi:glycine betaine/L-proline ABC transporter ATP-binding protein [Microbacterium sp. NPDC076911]|uniref:quaternary amine ABC transporter ATP-binding protein n=1 Tax=Microbacterium sp. NPDC076911 TaxID=3154958 RepID=UPI00342CA21B
MTVENALEARNLYKVFGRNPKDAVKRLKAGATRADVANSGTAAVIDASFTVKPGEIFVIMGLSGSGKSTVIRMLNGLLEPTSGDVLVQGRSVGTASAKDLRDTRRSSISMVFQHFALLPHRTVLENAAYALEIQGVAADERNARAREILEKVSLGDRADAMPSELSGGMQQRVGLARALTAGTDILLMDEAFSALDPLIRREMQEQLIELQQELGKTIIFITHDLNEAMFLGDRIAVMRDGRIVQQGTAEEILTDPADDYVAQFVADVDRARVLSASNVMDKARAVMSASAGPRAALALMRDMQTSLVYVVGGGRRLLGVVHDRDVMRLVKKGITTLDSVIRTDYPVVAPDQVLSDLFESAVESDLPLAVVDDQQRLLGVVPRVTLLAALGNITSDTGEMPVVELPPTTITMDMFDETLHETVDDAATPAVAPTEEVAR